MEEIEQPLYFYVIEAEVSVKTRHRNESIRILFGVYSEIILKWGQATEAV